MTTQHHPTMQALMDHVAPQSTEQILACIREIGGAFNVSQDERMVRAALIEVYAERNGEDAADALMDELGM